MEGVLCGMRIWWRAGTSAPTRVIRNTLSAPAHRSAVAALGLTDFDDASGGDQPWGTVLSELVVRELGLWEKQSSAYFAGRTPLTRVENCLFYNGP
jgi:hypothetical protein